MSGKFGPVKSQAVADNRNAAEGHGQCRHDRMKLPQEMG
jgi:hypothetical protein